MIHSKYCKPRIFPWNNDRTPEQIDRSQDIGGDLALNIEKQYEIGRDGKLGDKKNIPTFRYTMRQFEYGSMAFWYSLANKEDPGSGDDVYVDLDDFKTPKFDIAAFLTDDDDTFTGTIFFPKLRTTGFSINIADPEAIVERNFDLVGEDYKILDAKYYSYEKTTVVAPGDGTVTLDPVPIEYASGDYVFKVLRVRSAVVTELDEDAGAGDNTWVYNNATKVVTVKTCLASDIIKVYYPSTTAYDTLWTDNDSDDDWLLAESCEIRMKVGTDTRIYRLQSVGIDVALERTDYGEVGNSEKVLFGVKTKTTTISLNRYAEDVSLETILAGDTAYPYIDPREFADNIQLQVKIYSDKTHTTFRIGYLINNISPTALGVTQAVEDYQQATNTLESDNLKISTTESDIAFA